MFTRDYRMVKYWIKLLCTDNCILKIVMIKCLVDVIENQMISRTSAVRLKIFWVNMALTLFGYVKR